MSANISAKEVNELRQKTGSGMMDCKKALVWSEHSLTRGIEIIAVYKGYHATLLKDHMTLPQEGLLWSNGMRQVQDHIL